MNLSGHEIGTIEYGDHIEFETHSCIERLHDYNENYSILPTIHRGIELFHHCVESGKPLLVHCRVGINRSSTIVVAIVMAIMHIPIEEAIAHVCKYRKHAAPQYIIELIQFERELGINPTSSSSQ